MSRTASANASFRKRPFPLWLSRAMNIFGLALAIACVLATAMLVVLQAYYGGIQK